jgi:hypothetical protein
VTLNDFTTIAQSLNKDWNSSYNLNIHTSMPTKRGVCVFFDCLDKDTAEVLYQRMTFFVRRENGKLYSETGIIV